MQPNSTTAIKGTLLETAVSPANDKEDADRLCLSRAVAAHLKGKPTAALAILKSATPASEDFPEILAARARLHLELAQYGEALAEYEQLLTLRPLWADLGRLRQAFFDFAKSGDIEATETKPSARIVTEAARIQQPQEQPRQPEQERLDSGTPLAVAISSASIETEPPVGNANPEVGPVQIYTQSRLLQEAQTLTVPTTKPRQGGVPEERRESRCSFRIGLSLHVRTPAQGGVQQAQLRDMSKYGVRLETRTFIPPGTSIAFIFGVDRFVAQVRWSYRTSSGFLLGAEIQEIDSTAARQAPPPPV